MISPASWREGQKLVKMVLGRGPEVPGHGRLAAADGHGRTGGTLRLNVTSCLRAEPPLLYYCVKVLPSAASYLHAILANVTTLFYFILFDHCLSVTL